MEIISHGTPYAELLPPREDRNGVLEVALSFWCFLGLLEVRCRSWPRQVENKVQVFKFNGETWLDGSVHGKMTVDK